MTRWLDEDEARAWRGLVEVVGDVMASLAVEMESQHGLLPGDYGVLVQLSEAPDRRLRMCDLALHMHLSPSGLTRRLDGLVADGLVARVPSPGDRRVILATITERGMERLRRIAPDHVASVRRHLLDHLSPGQVRNLGAALESVRIGRTEMDVPEISDAVGA